MVLDFFRQVYKRLQADGHSLFWSRLLEWGLSGRQLFNFVNKVKNITLCTKKEISLFLLSNIESQNKKIVAADLVPVRIRKVEFENKTQLYNTVATLSNIKTASITSEKSYSNLKTCLRNHYLFVRPKAKLKRLSYRI